jgi:hypothetical protein
MEGKGYSRKGKEHGRKRKENVTEPPKLLGPPTVVLVQRTSDNPVDAPELLESSVSAFLTFPKSVSPVTQTLQTIEDTEMWKQLHNLTFIESKIKLVITDQYINTSAEYLILQYQGR